MANTATFQNATNNRMSYLMTGDGTVAGPTIAAATIIADADGASQTVNSPLVLLWTGNGAGYANQAAMRTAVTLGNPGLLIVQLRVAVNDVTAEHNQCSCDTDVDAVTATQPELNWEMSDTTGQLAILHIIHLHSLIR